MIQFRKKLFTVDLEPEEQERTGMAQRDEWVVVPYLMDLESTNGTKLNGKIIEGARYYELMERDVLLFAESHEYVFMRK